MFSLSCCPAQVLQRVDSCASVDPSSAQQHQQQAALRDSMQAAQAQRAQQAAGSPPGQAGNGGSYTAMLHTEHLPPGTRPMEAIAETAAAEQQVGCRRQ